MDASREANGLGKAPRAREIVARLSDQEFFYLRTMGDRVLRLIVTDDPAAFLDRLLAVADELETSVEIRERRSNRLILTPEAARQVLLETSLLRVLFDPQGAGRLEVLLEVWSDIDGTGSLQGARNNPRVSKLWAGNPLLDEDRRGGVDLRRAYPENVRGPAQFDVDYVFSWVNSEDPDWQRRIAPFRPAVETDASSASRHRAKNDLLYALRSLDRYAPWIRDVIIFTDCAPPPWLDLAQPGIRWVDFTEVFEERHLPTFNSHAIEAYVHKIPGLAEHFIYSCDDYFLARDTRREDFFLSNGTPRVRLESFAMVNGPVQADQPAYLNAARNSAECIYRDFGKYPTRLHTHSPQSLQRSTLYEMERRYPAEIERTRAGKFRSETDVVLTGFFFAHFAIASGRALEADTRTRLIKQDHGFFERMQEIQSQISKSGSSDYLSVCLNDGNGSHLNELWDQASDSFLNAIFSRKSRFET